MDESKISKLAKLRREVKQVATIVINGEPQGYQEVEYYHLVCPSCGRVITEFQPGLSELDIIKGLTEKDTQEALYKMNAYCPSCGQKLSYDREVIDIDANGAEKADLEG